MTQKFARYEVHRMAANGRRTLIYTAVVPDGWVHQWDWGAAVGGLSSGLYIETIRAAGRVKYRAAHVITEARRRSTAVMS